MLCALPCPSKGIIYLQVSCGVRYHMSQWEAVMSLSSRTQWTVLPCFCICNLLNDVLKGQVLWCLRLSSKPHVLGNIEPLSCTPGPWTQWSACGELPVIWLCFFLGWKIWQTLRTSAQTSSVTERCLFMVIYEEPTWKITARFTCQVFSFLYVLTS